MTEMDTSAVRCELLCFTRNKGSVLAFDHLVDLCCSFYTVDEIAQARMELMKYVDQRMPKHKGNEADKKKRIMADIVKICLDPTLNLPEFYAVDLCRLPPVGVQHVDVSALLLEVESLRAEVRAITTIKEDLLRIRQDIAAIRVSDAPFCRGDLTVQTDSSVSAMATSSATAEFAVTKSGEDTRWGIKRGDGVTDIHSTTYAKKLQSTGILTMANSNRIRPTIEQSTSNKRVKSVVTKRSVDIFISRLQPDTVDEDVMDCVKTALGNRNALNIECVKLKSKYEELSVSYYIAVSVDATTMKDAIEALMAPESWPEGLLVRRYFKPKNV